MARLSARFYCFCAVTGDPAALTYLLRSRLLTFVCLSVCPSDLSGLGSSEKLRACVCLVRSVYAMGTRCLKCRTHVWWVMAGRAGRRAGLFAPARPGLVSFGLVWFRCYSKVTIVRWLDWVGTDWIGLS
ncbi:hypothetical protein P171DRAFT_206576 [Karstenula rhodostoma CBS 690.94]|uniref:Uncharacterized protein n=1 Tax=Karstenula rhodostoma CBS 690.94 TaxID=1392251 RepID=A0A9P4PPR0_9PLEO|nr:hypothetical protein P171DRAFT_206576 [Karstenula rhodostoma CBS 690.94]